jgi:hypothetical protein
VQLKSKPTEFVLLHHVTSGAPFSVNPMLVRYFSQGDSPPYENATILVFTSGEILIVRETYSQVAALMLLP